MRPKALKIAKRRSNKSETNMFRKGRLKHANRSSEYLAWITFLQDLDRKDHRFGSQNWCTKSSKINTKTTTEQKSWKSPQIMFSKYVKAWKFIVQILVFDDLEGCVRERKRYQQIIENDFQIHQNWNQQIMNKSIKLCSVKKSSQIGPWSAQWSKRISGLMKHWCD